MANPAGFEAATGAASSGGTYFLDVKAMWVSSNAPIKKTTMGIVEKFREINDIRDTPMQKKPAYISAFFRRLCRPLGIVPISPPAPACIGHKGTQQDHVGDPDPKGSNPIDEYRRS